MTDEIYINSRPDFIPFNFTEREYQVKFQLIAKKNEKEHLFIRGAQIRLVGKIQKFIQSILVFFKLTTDYTDIVNVNSALLKFLYHGEAQGFLTTEKALGYLRMIKDRIEKSNEEHDRILKKVVQEIYEAHHNNNVNHTQHLQNIRKDLCTFHKNKIVQQHLTPCWWERRFRQPFKNKPLIHFGEIHLKMAKRYLKKENYQKALQQYIKAEKIKNLSPEFQTSFVKQLTAFLESKVKFTRDRWHKSVRPIVNSLVHTCLANKKYQDALDCLTAALKYTPKDHSLKIQYFETLYRLNELHMQPLNYEEVFLKEIEEWLAKLQNQPIDANESKHIKARLSELYYMLGFSLSKGNPQNVQIALRAVRYIEQSYNHHLEQDQMKDELYQHYLSTCEKILLYPIDTQVNTAEEVLILVEKAHQLKQQDYNQWINPLIKLCEDQERSAEAIDLYEKALEKWPEEPIVLNPQTFHHCATKLKNELEAHRHDSNKAELILKLYLKANEHGYHCFDDIIDFSLRIAEVKKIEAPQEAITHLRRVQQLCKAEPLKSKFNSQGEIDRKLTECYYQLIAIQLLKIKEEVKTDPKDSVKEQPGLFLDPLNTYDELLQLEPTNIKYHLEKALLIDAFELYNYPAMNVTKEMLNQHLAHVNLKLDENGKNCIQDLEKILEKNIHPNYNNKLRHYIALQCFNLGSTKLNDESIKYLEKASVKYAPQNDRYRQKLFETYLKAVEENQKFLNKLLFGNKDTSSYCEKAQKLMPDIFGHHIPRLIEFYSQEQRYPEAIELYRKWKREETVKISAETFYQNGVLLDKEDDLENAFVMYEEAALMEKDKTLYSSKTVEIAIKISHKIKDAPQQFLEYLKKGLAVCRDKVLEDSLIELMVAGYLQLIEDLIQKKTLMEALNKIEEAYQFQILPEQKEKLKKPLIEYYQKVIAEELPKIHIHERKDLKMGDFLNEHKETFDKLLDAYNTILKIDVDNAPCHFDKAMLINFFFLEDNTDIINIQKNEAQKHFEKAVELKKNWFYMWMYSLNKKIQGENAVQQEIPKEIFYTINCWVRDRFNFTQEIKYEPHTDVRMIVQDNLWQKAYKGLMDLLWKP